MIKFVLDKSLATKYKDIYIFTCPFCGEEAELSFKEPEFVCYNCGASHYQMHKIAFYGVNGRIGFHISGVNP